MKSFFEKQKWSIKMTKLSQDVYSELIKLRDRPTKSIFGNYEQLNGQYAILQS